MNKYNWKIEESEFSPALVEQNGSRFLIGNGFMGYRGTLEEFGKEQLVALNMAGLFDRNGDLWRESVNAPNPFFVKTYVGDKELNVLNCETLSHNQTLDISCGLHTRKTVFNVNDTAVTVVAERFVSMDNENLAVLKYSVSSDKDIDIVIKTYLDTDVWNINRDHFEVLTDDTKDGIKVLNIKTLENKIPMLALEYIDTDDVGKVISLKAGDSFSFTKVNGIYWGENSNDAFDVFSNCCKVKYDELFSKHKFAWEKIWADSDVQINGDDEAQFALRYSIYHLNSIVPRNTDKCGIPARGLSGQVYKGAAFWDTEMFMMPFFSFTNSHLCRNLVKYRINTLQGAKRKAKEFGFDGAFYAWESQETGDDACSLFNVTDVFTKRPMRTHFKDSQIHISADMVYGLWEYCKVTGDYSLLADGGLEMMYQCLLFFYSYAVFKPIKNRFELYDVVGPDEYHERVNNNAFTNQMVKYTADALVGALDYVNKNMNLVYQDFVNKNDISWVENFAQKLYVPKPNENGVIEQFDRYFTLEDLSLDELRKRELIPNEYWGGGNGLATTTRIIKQADVIMMLNVFRSIYSKEIKRANWEFYEPYTEHGSSLSACAYGIVATEIGMADWAYKYFMKTATVDLTGDTKQYVGDLYIGGTHPAANGGSGNTAIFGFAGVSYTDDTIDISPNLPQKWKSMSFKLLWKGVRLSIDISSKGVNITADKSCNDIKVTVNKKEYIF